MQTFLKYLIFGGVFLSTFLFNVSSVSAATLYRYGFNLEWTDLNSWWTDSGHTIQASSLPTISDDVVLDSSVATNGGPEPSVNSLTTKVGTGEYIIISITVANGATFNGQFQYGNGSSHILTGDAVFNGSSFNYGIVSGNATYNNTSTQGNSVTGTATFNNSSQNSNTLDTAIFNDTSYNSSTVSVTATFNDSSYNNGAISGTATFNDSSYNQNNISGNAVFNGNLSENNANVSGTKTRRYTSNITITRNFRDTGPWTVVADNAEVNIVGALYGANTTFQTLNGGSFIQFSKYWYQTGVDSEWSTLTGNWWDDEAHTIQSASLPNGSDAVKTLGTIPPNVDLDTWVEPVNLDISTTGIIFTSASNNTQGLSLVGDVTFNGSSYCSTNITGDVTFNGSSYNDSTITGDVTFNGSSYNNNTVTGNGVFNGSSYNNGTISLDATFNDLSYNNVIVSGDATFTYASDGVINLVNSQSWNTVEGLAKDVSGNVITGFVFNDTSYNNYIITSSNVTFNDSSYNNSQIAGATFNDSSYNNGEVTGDAIFNGNLSENNSSVNGTKTRRYTSNIEINRDFVSTGPWTVIADGAVVVIAGITYDETTTFQTLNGGSFEEFSIFWYQTGVDSEWSTLTGNWWDDEAHTIQSASLPNGSDAVKTLGTIPPNVDLDTWVEPLRINTVATGINFTSLFENGLTGNLTGNATFNDLSAHAGTITGDAIFHDTSINYGTITGDACFDVGATNFGAVSGVVTSPCPNIFTLTYSAGVNGSLTGDTSQTVNEGDDGTAVTAVPDSGYEFTSWSDASVVNPRTDLSVSGDITVTASFSLIAEEEEVVVEAQRTGSPGSVSKIVRNNLINNNTLPLNAEAPKDCLPSYKFSPSTGFSCASLNFTTSLPNIPVSPVFCILTQTLKQGSVGEQVKCLQSKLKISVDGIFGPKTKESVMIFQKTNVLNPDGIVGPLTRNKFF